MLRFWLQLYNLVAIKGQYSRPTPQQRADRHPCTAQALSSCSHDFDWRKVDRRQSACTCPVSCRATQREQAWPSITCTVQSNNITVNDISTCLASGVQRRSKRHPAKSSSHPAHGLRMTRPCTTRMPTPSPLLRRAYVISGRPVESCRAFLSRLLKAAQCAALFNRINRSAFAGLCGSLAEDGGDSHLGL